MKILVLVGSLRAASFSRKLALAASKLGIEGASFELIDGRDLPHYDQDLDGEEKPKPVEQMLRQVDGADALILITPEYNYGIPGSLKNLIDWASRPAFNSPLKGKPALVIALSMAPAGGARVHGQLSTVLAGTLTPTFLAPSFLVPAVHEKFEEAGELVDEVTKARLLRTLEGFSEWAAKLNAENGSA